MSTSILYHAFNLKGIKCKSTQFLGNTVIFSVEMTEKCIKCPACGCRHTILKGQKKRMFRTGPFGRKQSLLRLLMHRLQCIECQKIWCLSCLSWKVSIAILALLH